MAVPSIPNTDRIADYSPVSSTTDFAIPWPVVADSQTAAKDDLVVLVDDEALTSDEFEFVGATVTDNNGNTLSGIWNGGTVTLDDAASGVRVIIYSKRDPRRTGNFLEGKSLPFSTLDKLTDDEVIMMRDLFLQVKRSFKMPAAGFLDGVSGDVPVEASKYFGFDADKNPIMLDLPALSTIAAGTSLEIFVSQSAGATAELKMVAANTAAVSLGGGVVVDLDVTLTTNRTLTAKTVRYAAKVTTGAFTFTTPPPNAGRRQIFDATGGSVLFTAVTAAFPEWWGVVNDGSAHAAAWTACAATMNAVTGGIIDCASTTGGAYRVGSVTLHPAVLIRGAGEVATRFTTATGDPAFIWDGTGLGDPETTIFGGGIVDCNIQCDNYTGTNAGVVTVKNAWSWRSERVWYYDGNGATATTKTAIYMEGYCFHAIIRDNRITYGTPQGAILLNLDGSSVGANSSHIDDNDIAPIDGGTAIRVVGPRDVQISHNRIEWASGKGGLSIEVQDCVAPKIHHNECNSNLGANAQYQIYVHGNCIDWEVSSNRIMVLTSSMIGVLAASSHGSSHDNRYLVESAGLWCAKIAAKSNVTIHHEIVRMTADLTGGAFYAAAGSDHCGITGCRVYGKSPTPYTGTGVLVDNGADFIDVTGNHIFGLATGVQSLNNNASPTCKLHSNYLIKNTDNKLIFNPLSVDDANNVLIP